LFYSPLRVIERLNKCFMQGRSIRINKKKRIFVFFLNDNKKTNWFVHKKTKRWHH
jgi:hypothetical protein